MKNTSERDRRKHPRFPHILELQATEVPALELAGKNKPLVVGRVQNMSKGGICLLSYQPLPSSALLRCEVGVTEVPVGIPTLMQVRWTKKQNLQMKSYLSGLQFLL